MCTMYAIVYILYIHTYILYVYITSAYICVNYLLLLLAKSEGMSIGDGISWDHLELILYTKKHLSLQLFWIVLTLAKYL